MSDVQTVQCDACEGQGQVCGCCGNPPEKCRVNPEGEIELVQCQKCDGLGVIAVYD